LHGAVIDASNGLGVNPSALYKRRESWYIKNILLI
jgi:hypothetical protein